MSNIKRAAPGQRFDRMVSLRRDEASVPGSLNWYFRCDCGVEKSVRYYHVFSGRIKSCGCKAREFITEYVKDKKNERHPQWSKNPSYKAIHLWLRREFTKTGICTFCTSKEDRTEYALIRGKDYARLRENFVELCVPCHRAYDKETRKLTGKLAYDWKSNRRQQSNPITFS